MTQKYYAVITGDIINSARIQGDYTKILQAVSEDILKYQNAELVFDTYRGDSFQALIPEPQQAMLLSLIFRAGLRRNSNDQKLESIWDARISVGIGKVKNQSINKESKIGALDGEAFVLSGRILDAMKKENNAFKITTPNKELNKAFTAICPLIDAITQRWTTAQAEAVYIYLLRNLTQKEIGKMLNISQKAISKRLVTSNIEKIKPFLSHFNELIQWNFNN
jgi:predicted DNA-binding protein (UPF0251 family)